MKRKPSDRVPFSGEFGIARGVIMSKRKPSKKTRDVRVIWVLVHKYAERDGVFMRWAPSKQRAVTVRRSSLCPAEWRGPYRVELPMAVARRVCGE